MAVHGSKWLNILLRRPVEAEIEVEDILKFEPSDLTWGDAVQEAKKFRPELRQSDIAIDQADKNITLTKAPYLPAVTVSANYLKQEYQITQLPNLKNIVH